ncbi:MAG: single-stranded-DNA-specific exonuclease RecJ [Clostridiales bacterium]|jgi:single-stranded-DNA-specific exonuclease|nr:single-stranded-DNA-specific exonuclease RecJ [Clostridiales bacterium]
MKKWIINKPDTALAEKIVKQSNLSRLCADVLVSRGITDIEQASKFLNVEGLEAPYIIKDMQKAAEIINDAVNDGKKICIYGDYDCDGITSTVILYSYLECIGADVTYYIPERDEGYGINKESIKELSEDGVELIITVDNGISAFEEAEFIYELGMDLIITDHHQPGERLPRASAIVNPHRRDCPSEFKALCGAGVALKLVAAMDGGDYDMALEEFGDLAAIGTVADIVKLESENRFIVENGLRMIKNTERVGLLALIEASGLAGKEITSTSIGFMIAPRINASGRFGSPKQAVELLLCEDPDEAQRLANELNALNNERKKIENKIMLKIAEQVTENPEMLNERVLIFSGEDWHHGVIGIVASRMVERFGKPSFVITVEGDVARGSVRSFGEFSVFKCLEYCSELLLRYGGHKSAGGFSIATDKIPDFVEMVKQYALTYHDIMPDLTIEVDKLLLPDDINGENINSLKMLEPFGEGNRQPLFSIYGAIIDSIISLSNGAHTKLKLIYGNKYFYAMMFRTKVSDISMQKGEKWDFIVSLENNSYSDKTTCILLVKDYRKSGIKQLGYFSAKSIYEKYLRGEEIPYEYYTKICPVRDEMIKVYKLIPSSGIDLDTLFMKLAASDINYCKMKATIDILRELNLVNYNAYEQKVSLIPAKRKVNLEESSCLKKLRSKI